MKRPLGNYHQHALEYVKPDLCVDCIARCPVEGFVVQSCPLIILKNVSTYQFLRKVL